MTYYQPEESIRLHDYGRHVQEMIDHLKTIENPERRSKMALDVLRIMAVFSPMPKDTPEYKRKLWEHLHQMANYELQITGPFPIPEKPPVEETRKRPAYYVNRAKYKQYGHIIELMIQKAVGMEDSPAKETYVLQIAQIMKQFLVNYSSAVVNDEVVFSHLADLSKGELILDTEGTRLRATFQRQPYNNQTLGKIKKHNNNRQNFRPNPNNPNNPNAKNNNNPNNRRKKRR